MKNQKNPRIFNATPKAAKRVLAVLLTLLMLFSAVPLAPLPVSAAETTGKKITEYNTGDIIEFGYYPQSEVTDDALKDTLTSLAGSTDTWTSYGYYSGTGDWDDGKMTASDYMVYTDIVYDNNKYRGVYFTQYRSNCTGYIESLPNQEDNGYNKETIYWFKYDLIQWRVLDPSTGLVMSEMILDSQAYNNYVLKEAVSDPYYDNTYWGNSSKTYYVNNYEYSSIRAWLNDDFYNTAFNAEQQNKITMTTLDNTAYDTFYSAYNASGTNDKIFLLSWNDILNTNYGFVSTTDPTETRQVKGSAYAKSQGLYVSGKHEYTSGTDEYSYWHLRSAGNSSYNVCSINYAGYAWYYNSADSADQGVRPAMCLNTETVVKEADGKRIWQYNTGDIIEFGWYPQSEVTDDALKDTLTSLAGSTDTWTSYGYYSGTGIYNDGQMQPSDYMKYTDVFLNSCRYRGVYFSFYRSYLTGGTLNKTGVDSFQNENCYYADTVYWFKYEPVKWRILESGSGLVISESILDSQTYNNFLSHTEEDDFGDIEQTHYANNYEYSSIRAWLNADFYNTVFSAEQQTIIEPTTINNDAHLIDKYNANATTDKLFLLSLDEAKNISYFSDDSQRQAQGTAYAKAQGLRVYTDINSSGNSFWLLRSAGTYLSYDYYSCFVGDTGSCSSGYNTYHTFGGIRPAFCFETSADIIQSSVMDLCKHENTESRDVTGATCGKDGYTGDTYCTDCGTKIATGTTIPATGKHSWNSGTVTDNATCIKEGTRKFTCTVCNATKTEKTEKAEHTLSEWQTDYNPTCTDGGSRHKECLYCHEVLVREAIPALGHHDHNGDGDCDTCGINMEDYLRSICSCNCHKSGFAKFIWKILNFFYKLFGIKQYCSCGAKHW